MKIKSILGLSLSLAKVKFKLRNEGSYLGIFWYLLNPLALFLILLLLRDITKIKIEHYPAYLFLGLIMFNFFRHATSVSVNAIKSNAGLIRSLKINLEPLVISSILQAVFSHFFEIILLAVFLLYFKISLLWLLFYPVIFFFLFIFSIGVGFLVSSCGVYINDLENIWNIFLNLMWFATPIFYSIPAENIFLAKINPMFYFIDSARNAVVYGSLPELKEVLVLAIFSFIFLAFGIFVFEKLKIKFAEIA